MDLGENVVAVHDVRLAVNDRTTIQSRCQQVARVNITAAADFGGAIRGRILVRRQLRFLCHRGRDGIGERQFLIISAAQKAPDHLETLVIQLQFILQIGAIQEQMKMIRIGQCRTVRIAPGFGIEMQAQHEIGMQLRVHEHCPATNLAVAVE